MFFRCPPPRSSLPYLWRAVYSPSYHLPSWGGGLFAGVLAGTSPPLEGEAAPFFTGLADCGR